MPDPKTKDGWLIKYINDIRADERERCAKEIEEVDRGAEGWGMDMCSNTACTLAAAIRAMGKN
jgi:hypothetical protein